MRSNSVVYEIRNIVNDKRYVGSTFDFDKRVLGHKNALRKGDHHSILLQRAWNKYGENSFVFEILEEVYQKNLSKKEFRNPLCNREQYYKDLYKSYDSKYGYDICKIAGSKLGFECSKETRLKLSEKAKLRKHSPESRRKIGNSLRGIVRSEETRQRIKDNHWRKRTHDKSIDNNCNL